MAKGVRAIVLSWYRTRQGDTIGVVLVVDDEHRNFKGYIGLAAGGDERADAAYIAMTGARIEESVLRTLAGARIPDGFEHWA